MPQWPIVGDFRFQDVEGSQAGRHKAHPYGSFVHTAEYHRKKQNVKEFIGLQ
jgi:hypothetical protein